MVTRIASRVALVAVPVVALVVLGVDSASTSFGALPPVVNPPAAPKSADRSVAASKESPVLDLTTWEETVQKSGIRR